MPTPAVRQLTLREGDLSLALTWDANSPAAMATAADGSEPQSSFVALVDLAVDGEGPGWAGTRSVASSVGRRLRVADVRQDHGVIRINQCDDTSGLVTITTIATVPGTGSLRAYTAVRNDTEHPVTLRSVTSLVTGLDVTADDADVTRGRNDWLGENRWSTTSLRATALADVHLGRERNQPRRLRGALRSVSTSSWSTAEELPLGVIVQRNDNRGWLWQIEHNGAWTWQLGEHNNNLYLALSGPNDTDHQWSHQLMPGQTFTSVPVTLSASRHGFEGAVSAVTALRRVSRELRDPGLPVVFNDYMNTVMGDPNAERLHPLIDAAADVGADIFVIDAGWYADDGDWWDAVGEWQPSTQRFPDGISRTLDRIRDAGMRPGLWLEPEVVGVRSPVADKLPGEAFMSRDGHRIIEDGRYHLDLSHPAAREHLDEVVDRLVHDYGVGYLKLDYNIRAGAGTDRNVVAVGDGLLRHNRAYLSWIDELRTRHPSLLLENCASGAMRQDAAQLRRHDLQSTSDQELGLLYPPIAAAAAVTVSPDQAANWAYPQPSMTTEEITFTLVTGLAGRLYLSGFVDEMTREQRELVRGAVALHRSRRGLLTHGKPTWPLGLPRWDDPWVASGLLDAVQGTWSVNVWRRPGAAPTARLRLPTAPTGRTWQTATEVFPARHTGASWTYTLDAHNGWLDVSCTDAETTARVVMVTSTLSV